jgi:hypothetical protein
MRRNEIATLLNAVITSKPNIGDKTVMHGTTTTQFNCANCKALYHLIKVEAGPETADLRPGARPGCTPRGSTRNELRLSRAGRGRQQRVTNSPIKI